MKTYDQITTDVRNIIKNEYNNGNSIDNISLKTTVCIDLIYQILFEEDIITTKSQYKPRYTNRSLEWKQAVADYYMHPHTRFETKTHFRTSDRVVDKVIAEFNLPRRTQSEELRIVHENNFGSHKKYLEHMIEAQKATSQRLYGVDNFAKSDLFRKKSVSTYRTKYGVDNPMQCEMIKKKLSDSCMEKFGVAWPCMREEARFSGFGGNSAPNVTFYNELLQVFSSDMIQREFTIGHYSYDFKIGKNLIEINPTSTHNSTWGLYEKEGKPKTYHKDKSEVAKESGYRCIHVWDWDSYSSIIKLLQPRTRIYARDCEVREVDVSSAKSFIEENHIQRYAKDSIRLALIYDNKIVSIMTFGTPRYNKKYQYELIRYCSSYNVIGGAERLFKNFIKLYNPESVISYCDQSKFDGKTYEKLGFSLQDVSISKHWVSMKTGRHITDNLLRQRGFDQLFGLEYGCYGKGTSNEDLMLKHNFVVVYDAGQATYIWKK